MVYAFKGSSKRTFAKERFDFVAKSNVVVINNFIITFLIVVAKVIFVLFLTINLFVFRCPNEVYHGEVQYFFFLVFCQH